MKVFMIGGTGMLGSEGARELIKRGHCVSSISLPPIPTGANIPKEMELSLGNYLELTDDEIRGHMRGADSFVFAAGIDERVEGPAPVYDLFYKYNVKPLEKLLTIAKEEGVKQVVILGSYFTYFERTWPELNMYDTHPYIRSRVDQAKMALSFADENMAVSVLELPYIFGAQAGRKPVWVFLVEQIRAMKKKTMYPKGGTTMVTIKQVGQCIAGAVENGKGGQLFPVGYYNLTWVEMLTIFHKYMGTPDKKIVTIPKFLYKLGMKRMIKVAAEKGIEPGLDYMGLAEIMTREAFIDKKTIVDAFGVTEDDIDKAIGDSVGLCVVIIDENTQTIDMKCE